MKPEIRHRQTSRTTQSELVDATVNDDVGVDDIRRAAGSDRRPPPRKRWKFHICLALAVAAMGVSALACGRIGFAPTQNSTDDGASSTFSLAGAAVNPHSRHTMVVTGGVAPYQFNVRAGQASIDKVTGELRTPMFSQDVVIEALDATN